MTAFLKRIWAASNPRLWMYVGGPYALGVLIGLSYLGRVSTHPLTLTVLVYFVWFLIFASTFSVLLNDYCDREIDAINPKKGTYSARYNTADLQLYRFVIAFSVLVFVLLSLFFPDARILLFGTIFLAINVVYDVPPFRFKERTFFDLIFGLVCLMPLLAGYSLVTGLWPASWAIVAGMLYFVALELFDKTFDIIPDFQAGVTTSAVRLGKKYSLVTCTLLLVASSLIVYIATQSLLYTVFIAPYLIYITIAFSIKDYEKLLIFYGKLFLLNNLWGMLISTYFITIAFFF